MKLAMRKNFVIAQENRIRKACFMFLGPLSCHDSCDSSSIFNKLHPAKLQKRKDQTSLLFLPCTCRIRDDNGGVRVSLCTLIIHLLYIP